MNVLLALAGARAGLAGKRLKVRARQYALLALFALVASVFALATVTAALASEIGTINALLVMTVAALVGCTVMALLLKSEAASRRERERERAAESRLYRAAAVSSLPVLLRLRRGGLVAIAAVALLGLLLGRAIGNEPED